MNHFEKTLDNYSKYLTFLEKKLSAFFKAQSPYIACKKGCSFCCQNAQFPYSFIEFNYLIYGSMFLEKDIQKKIDINIKTIKNQKEKFSSELFKYDCPFLIENTCSLYKYRGIVCRTFGLIEEKGNEQVKIPFCHEKGLNYAIVVDEKKKIISNEKYLALNEKNKPLAYNINYDFLTGEKIEKQFGFKFGEKKPLIEWL